MFVLLHATRASIGLAAAPATPAAAALLGVEIGDVPPEYPRRFGAAGAYVLRVVTNSAAEASRILPGDVIVGIHTAPVTDHGSFRTASAGSPPEVPSTSQSVATGDRLRLRSRP